MRSLRLPSQAKVFLWLTISLNLSTRLIAPPRRFALFAGSRLIQKPASIPNAQSYKQTRNEWSESKRSRKPPSKRKAKSRKVDCVAHPSSPPDFALGRSQGVVRLARHWKQLDRSLGGFLIPRAWRRWRLVLSAAGSPRRLPCGERESRWGPRCPDAPCRRGSQRP